MKVKLTVQISGTRDGEPWPAPGASMDLPADEAVALINNGMAQAVAVSKREAAVEAKDMEVAVAPAPKRTKKAAPKDGDE